MKTALHSLLLAAPQAAAVWLVIIVVALLALATLTVPGRLRAAAVDPDRDAAPAGRARSTRRSRPARPSTADDRDPAHRYADEVGIAADRAAVTARRRRTEWERAQDALDETWTAFDAAERAAHRFAAAGAFPVMTHRCRPGDLADRERYLHRAATAACRRREITVHELNDILAHRGGWDPRRHQVAQEVLLSRAVRDRCLFAYRAAAEHERQAWRTAEVAAAALQSLRDEAFAAKLRAGAGVRTPGQIWWAEQWAPQAPPEFEPVTESSDTVVIADLVAH